jgi:hypothetical protein
LKSVVDDIQPSTSTSTTNNDASSSDAAAAATPSSTTTSVETKVDSKDSATATTTASGSNADGLSAKQLKKQRRKEREAAANVASGKPAKKAPSSVSSHRLLLLKEGISMDLKELPEELRKVCLIHLLPSFVHPSIQSQSNDHMSPFHYYNGLDIDRD